MDRPTSYTYVKYDGQPGWRIPYGYKALPSGGNVVAIDPQNQTHLVKRKLLRLY